MVVKRCADDRRECVCADDKMVGKRMCGCENDVRMCGYADVRMCGWGFMVRSELNFEWCVLNI